MAIAEPVGRPATRTVPIFTWPNLLLGLGGMLMLVDVYLIFMVAPTDSVLGNVQRVFYFHVPMAIMSFLAFFVVFVAGILYLVKRKEKWDRLQCTGLGQRPDHR